jgi:Mg2+/citrate symporter
MYVSGHQEISVNLNPVFHCSFVKVMQVALIIGFREKNRVRDYDLAGQHAAVRPAGQSGVCVTWSTSLWSMHVTDSGFQAKY